jgi:quinol monooxygenase YgiN
MAIGLLATIKVQPGKGDEFEAAFGELQKAVKANEKGCLQYDLFRSKEENTYYVYEQYADEAAVAAHRGAEHAKAPGAKVGPCLAGRPDVKVLEKVS